MILKKPDKINLYLGNILLEKMLFYDTIASSIIFDRMAIGKIKTKREGTVMKKMLDYLPTGVVVFEAQEPNKIIYANEVFMQIAGVTEEQLLKSDMSGCNEMIYPEDQHILTVAIHQAKKMEYSNEYEWRMKCKVGTYHWYVFRIRYIEESAVCCMSVWNVHERKMIEEELYVQTERYRVMEKITGELPLDYDVESKEFLVPAKYLAMRGKEDILEHFAKADELEDIVHGQDMSMLKQNMELASRQEKQGELEIRINISDEPWKRKYAWYRMVYKSIFGMDGKIIRIIGRLVNINQEKIEHFQLYEQARKNPLTGLLNKQATKDAAEVFLQTSSGEKHAVMVIDIDNFKKVNDNFGHLFGDTVLLSIAEKITGAFRNVDIIGRVGGDEFFVLMKHVDRQNVEEKVKVLCRDLRQQYHGDEQDVIISCSVGIAFFEQDGSTYEELFEQADCAMYQAKFSGKNQYCFAEGKNQITDLRKLPRDEVPVMHKNAEGQDASFLSAAFFLLAHAREVNTSLNLLLERIGKRYNLDVVAILEDTEEEGTFVQTNCWKKSAGIVADPMYIDNYENWAPYMTGFDERGLLCVDDYAAVEDAQKQRRLRSGKVIKAIVNSRFECQHGRGGMISFCDLTQNREWTEFEKDTFLEISKIISVFVSLRSNQIENQRTILSLKSRDLTTGLLNDKAFRKAAAEKLAKRESDLVYAMVYMDIREFSYVNENFGYETGNQILKEFATALASIPTVLAGRLHSDLFICLVWDDSKEQIEERVRKRLKNFSQIQHKDYYGENLYLVAGIYFIDSMDEDIDTMIENANLTRKQIKGTTSGSVCRVYTDELRIDRERKRQIINGFEDALKEERILVYVQPKFLLKTMELSGGEALVRWQKSDGTMEYPNVFIPVLEKSGFIVKLDFYVFEQVLKYQKKWKEQGRELCRISVNFSRKHFEGEGIYHRVCQLTQSYGIEPKYIEIEITESILVAGSDMVRTEIGLLRSAGFSIAIDDFGTGYSSLSMLRDTPVDIVKIDKSFLDKSDMGREKEFIERIGKLIRSVKEEVVFEGIETEQQLEFLVDCGFRYGQGYLYDRPLPIDVFEEKYMK